MAQDRTVTIGYPDEETKARVQRLIAETPERRRSFEAGLQHAVSRTIPRIFAGAFGQEPVRIMFSIEQIVAAGERGARATVADPEERYLWCQGVLCACLPAANEYGRYCEALRTGAIFAERSCRLSVSGRTRHPIDFGPLPVWFPVAA